MQQSKKQGYFLETKGRNSERGILSQVWPISDTARRPRGHGGPVPRLPTACSWFFHIACWIIALVAFSMCGADSVSFLYGAYFTPHTIHSLIYSLLVHPSNIWRIATTPTHIYLLLARLANGRQIELLLLSQLQHTYLAFR